MSSTGSSRGNPSIGDIVRSVAVLGVLILALWGLGQVFTNTPDRSPKAIDYASTVRSARPAAEFELLAPAQLPSGWVATSARFTPTSWHLGVITDKDAYIGLEQEKVDVMRVIDEFAKDSKAAGTATIDGKIWDFRRGPGANVTYTRSEAGLATLVTGEAPRAAVEDYVSSLSAS